jgi:hypothetical protein
VAQSTIDYTIDMYHKLMLKVYNRAKKKLDIAICKQRKHFKKGEYLLNEISIALLDESILDKDLRPTIFNKLGRDTIQSHALTSEIWLTGKFSNVFNLVMDRFSYLRQFAPQLLHHIELEMPKNQSNKSNDLIKAIQLLRKLNKKNQRTMPANTPICG